MRFYHFYSAISSCSFLLISLFACEAGVDEGLPTSGDGSVASCSEPLPGHETPIFLERTVSIDLQAGSIRDAVSRLNRDLDLPISFIESAALGPEVRCEVSNSTVRALLRCILASNPAYQCGIIEGHVVVWRDSPELHAVVEDVDIVRRPRAAASRAYVDRIAGEVDGFQDLGCSFGGLADAPVFGAEVTLSREATVLHHLAQLLGGDSKAFFWIRRSATGTRYFTLGAVP